MTPADPAFQTVMRFVKSAVENREAAGQIGGRGGRALARLSERHSAMASDLARELAIKAALAHSR